MADRGVLAPRSFRHFLGDGRPRGPEAQRGGAAAPRGGGGLPVTLPAIALAGSDYVNISQMLRGCCGHYTAGAVV